MKQLWIILSFLLVGGVAHADLSGLKGLYVQDGGRYKPFHTFARETMQIVYGKQNYKSKDPVEIVFTWMLLPDHWIKTEIVKIDYRDLKKNLGLPETKKYYTPIELLSNPRLQSLIQDVKNKKEDQERMGSFDQAVQTLANQLSLFQAISQGFHPGLIPNPGADADKWKAFRDFSPEEAESFSMVSKAFVNLVTKMEKASDSDYQALNKATADFTQKNIPQDFQKKHKTPIKVEVHYNKLAPFLWAWIMYALAGVLLFMFWVLDKKMFYTAAWVFLIGGFIMHTYGFALRVYLTGRPPVSNMYETVIWVPWAAIISAMIFEWKKKNQFMLLASAISGVFCLILADMAPGVLDATLQPLEPVLRSNLWLVVHVLTITFSYGTFLLAFVLADIALFFILKDEIKYKKKINEIENAIYRSEKVGVVLLAAGTILGGVWADYSWGRFWGWDPKETWALIALLGYLALLHAKQGGLLRQVGLIAGSVIAFSLVVMAWYGVNYVLGAGLHSYGFGAGGIEFVSIFVGAHFIFVAFVLASRRKKKS
ncbi:MAG: cytochrome c biogenesis protein [Bdellovibrionales bacterium]